MATAVSTLPVSGTGFSTFKKILSEGYWLFNTLGAASRVANSVRGHRVPNKDDLAMLGLDAAQFPRSY